MNTSTAAAVAALCGYLVGSIPFGLIAARRFGRIDIRLQGSGNIGATNVGRVLGARWGVLVLLLDCLKGLLPVLLVPALLPVSDADRLHVAVLCGVATVLGHMYPVWLGFCGGKGVATSLGVILVLAPWATLVALGVFAAVFAATRIVSAASVLASVGFAAWQMLALRPDPFSRASWSLAVFSLLVPAMIVLRHRTNLVRLSRGEEQQFHLGRREAAAEAERTATDEPAGPGAR